MVKLHKGFYAIFVEIWERTEIRCCLKIVRNVDS